MDKNKILSQALVTTMLAGVVASGLPTNVLAENKLPSDLEKIKSEGAREAVKELFEKGKLSGFADNTFRPDQKVTRAEFLAMVLRVLPEGTPVKEMELEFADSVEGKHWHYAVLEKAHAVGIFSGAGVDKNDRIIGKPDEIITREEMLTILVRAHELVEGKEEISSDEVKAELAKFKDADKLPSWSKGAVAKALKYKLTSGLSEDRIGAGEKGDRLQSAIFAYRQLKQSEAPVEEVPGEENPGEELPVEDKVAPVITLKGNDSVTVYEGDVFTDAGVTATDAVDGDVSANVVVTGDVVDVNKPGTYVLKYNVSDKAGNKAKEVTRTVVVKEGVAKLSPVEEVIHLKESGVTVGEVKTFLSERHAMPVDAFHFVIPRATQYALTGTPDVLVGDYEDELVVHVKHTKVEDEFTKSTIYDVVIDKTAKEIVVDTQNKKVTASDLNTLNEVKAAFETKAKSIIGENEVEFFVEEESKKEVFGDSIVLVEDEKNEVIAKVVKFVFGDALVVENVGTDALEVKGLAFENLLDLYKYNDSTKVYDVVSVDNEVEVDGTFTFEKLVPGKYKVVQQPIELGEPGERPYDDEYDKRFRNENEHKVAFSINGQVNDSGAYRLVNNYGSGKFVLSSTNEATDFVKEEQTVAVVDNVTELKAELVYQYRTERVNFKDATLTFGSESVDHDKDATTPNVTYQTVQLNATPDYEKFALGESFNFTLVVKDFDPVTKEVRAKAEIPLKATVVLKNAALSLEVKPQ